MRAPSNRRTALGAIMAVPLVSVPAMAESHPDAALLAIGRRFDEAVAHEDAYRPHYEEACRQVEAAMQAAHDDPSSRICRARDLYEQEQAYGDLYAPFDDVLKQGDALISRCGTLTAEALSLTPRTVAGLAVIARCIRYECPGLFAEPPQDRDWDDRLISHLVGAVLTMTATNGENTLCA